MYDKLFYVVYQVAHIRFYNKKRQFDDGFIFPYSTGFSKPSSSHLVIVVVVFERNVYGLKALRFFTASLYAFHGFGYMGLQEIKWDGYNQTNVTTWVQIVVVVAVHSFINFFIKVDTNKRIQNMNIQRKALRGVQTKIIILSFLSLEAGQWQIKWLDVRAFYSYLFLTNVATLHSDKIFFRIFLLCPLLFLFRNNKM